MGGPPLLACAQAVEARAKHLAPYR